MTTEPTSTNRWAAMGFRPPDSNLAEPDQPVTVDYLHDGRIAVITLNRPAADNAITTEMGALLTEIVESIAIRTEVRVVILTGAGDRAFSVGSDLRQRKAMTKQDWLRQRQDFDRTLYTVRQLRKPIFAAVNGAALRRGLRTGSEHRLHHRLRQRHLRPTRSHDRPGGRRGLPGAPAAAPAAREGPCRCCSPAIRSPRKRPSGWAW